MVGSPSLLRHYPDSTVQRTSRHPGRPSLTLADRRLVGTPHHRRGFPCFIGLPMPACRRHYPGGTVGCICRSLPQRWQPSPYSGQVGFRIQPFEACSAFTHYGLHARRVTKMTRYIVGFDALVNSFIATIATGWGDPCRVGLTPTERPCLCTAHPVIRSTLLR